MNIQGHYINLDSSTDRRELIEANLAQEGMSEYFTRFSALRGDGRPANITQGELGCYLSHETIINNSKAGSHTLILEDDAVLPLGFKNRFFSILQSALRQPWDILFLCQSVGFSDFHLLAQLMAVTHQLQIQRTKTRQPQYAFLDAKTYYRWGCTSYLIRAGAQQKVSQCLRLDSANGHHQAIDLAYQQAAREGRILAKCVMPYQVGTRDVGTTISDRGDILHHQLHSTLINLFVEGLDKSELYKKAQSGFSDAPLNGPAFVVSQMQYKKLIDMSRRAAAALERS